jgi:hypothetical protein
MLGQCFLLLLEAGLNCCHSATFFSHSFYANNLRPRELNFFSLQWQDLVWSPQSRRESFFFHCAANCFPLKLRFHSDTERIVNWINAIFGTVCMWSKDNVCMYDVCTWSCSKVIWISGQRLLWSISTSQSPSLAVWHSSNRVRLQNRISRVRIPPWCKVLGKTKHSKGPGFKMITIEKRLSWFQCKNFDEFSSILINVG